MTDRRHHPRLNANMVWRPAGLQVRPCGVADVSLGGARVYSDDLMPVGARIEVELLVPGGPAIELHARVARVTILRPSAPAFCDLALQFLAMTDDASSRLASQMGVMPVSLLALQPRVEEQHCDQVEDVEHQHCKECLPEPAARAPLARGPHGDSHAGEENRDQNELLHRPRS